ncbi:MAG: class I SAM-dependent methyltransferase [Bryobacteraceae bacterium]
MRYSAVAERLPGFLRRHVLHFETVIEEQVTRFAASAKPRDRVLDAGAGEGRYSKWFAHARYTGIDLAVGDSSWNYGGLDAVGDLTVLPFRDNCFAECLNIVTLEHVREPALVIRELARVLASGGRLLLIVPHEWEVHQSPHDYFRYTRHGVEYLLQQAGFAAFDVQPIGGYFRLMARRLLNGLQFFTGGLRWILFLPAALFLVPPALILPFLDFLDKDRNFTLGYTCIATKR